VSRVLLLGDYRQSLTIARSLATRGDVVVAAITEGRGSYLDHSRAVAERWYTPASVGDDAYDREVLDAIERLAIDVVFPVGDLEIAWASADLDRFGVPFASVALEVARTCQDKPALLDICADLGVDHSASRVVDSIEALDAAVAEFGLPAIVKSNDPLLRLLGRKGVVLRSRVDVDAAFRVWPQDHESLIVQRYVDGPRHNLYFVAERGEIRGISEVEIVRTDMVDGTGYAVDGRTVPISRSLRDETERLVAELKYDGVGCTQFLVSPDGETSFLELNPRLGANFAVVDRAGLHLARAAVDIALDRPVEPVTPRIGVRYAWSTGDLDGLVTALRRREIGTRGALQWVARLLRSAMRADVHVTWSWRDPVPAVRMLWRSVVKRALAALLRRR
jgi:predicted ATP-grasp superfamily ATP-dependent carboligase